MHKSLLVLALLLWFAGVALFIYWFWPLEQQFTIAYLVPE